MDYSKQITIKETLRRRQHDDTYDQRLLESFQQWYETTTDGFSFRMGLTRPFIYY